MIDAKEARRLTDIANGNPDVYLLEDILNQIKRTASTGCSCMGVSPSSLVESKYLHARLTELGFNCTIFDEYDDFNVNW